MYNMSSHKAEAHWRDAISEEDNKIECKAECLLGVRPKSQSCTVWEVRIMKAAWDWMNEDGRAQSEEAWNKFKSTGPR